MTAMPPPTREYLSAPSLRPLWSALRDRLERSGHVVRGTIEVEVDHDGADRLSGLIRRPLAAGRSRVRLADLDAALRSSAAGRGLVAVVAELTGAPLRDRPAERHEARATRAQLWADLDRLLTGYGLASGDWVGPWTEWLHRGGALTRLPPSRAVPALTAAIKVLAVTLDSNHDPLGLAGLAAETTGDAHGLDEGTPAAALALRALSIALDAPPPVTPALRRELWQRAGESTDEISGTVITWGLRPPGGDRWSRMMRERADLGLITHLSAHELHRASELTSPGEIVHVCENPQVLQRLAAEGARHAVACTSGNPAAAGVMLLARARVAYHGDFDWPGIAIARRMFGRGARPWRFGRDDYRQAVDHLPPDSRLALSGRAEATPWDAGLARAMAATDVAVHEEAIADLLLADLC